MKETLTLLESLIRCRSITPDDAGCQSLIATLLKSFGFTVETLQSNEVTNLWAHHGNAGPYLVFVGHTDVVPPGPVEQWQSDPFDPSIRDGKLYGRGAADMKSGLAAMITAATRFVKTHPKHAGQIAFLITSDEEGAALHGTNYVVEILKQRGIQIDYCIVGEASSQSCLGDTVKIGRRGSLNGILTLHGQQGHIAYPQLAKNPIHLAAPVLHALTREVWDHGNEFFPATSFQISNIKAGTGAHNVIPADLTLAFNFRFAPVTTASDLQQRVTTILNQQGTPYHIDWLTPAEPFFTPPGTLVKAISQAIQQTTQQTPRLSTDGGTSDGRFIAPLGAQVVEFGPINDSIHKINEHILIADLEPLTTIYERTLTSLFLTS